MAQTEQQLAAGLTVDPKITGASSFYNRETAEAAVAAALESNEAELNSWLSGNAPRLKIDYNHNSAVGLSLQRGASSAVQVYGVRIILVRDPAQPLGYYILTGYPR